MAGELTGLDVLGIAERMERDAATFYRRAAGLYDDTKLSKLFSELAQWEKRHMEVFAQLKQRLAEGGQMPREKGIARTGSPHVPGFEWGSTRDGQLTGRESRAQVLQMAIEKEKDAIAYYTGLREFVLGEADVGVVKEIIREEDRHVRILTQSLEQIA